MRRFFLYNILSGYDYLFIFDDFVSHGKRDAKFSFDFSLQIKRGVYHSFLFSAPPPEEMLGLGHFKT